MTDEQGPEAEAHGRDGGGPQAPDHGHVHHLGERL